MEKRAIASLIAVGAIAVAVVMAAGCIENETPAEMTAINIGYQPTTHQIAAMLASEKGWWEEDLAGFGIEKVTMKEFPSGPPEMHAMLSGDLNVAYVGVAPVIAAMYEGLDAKIVANVQTQGSALVVRPEFADEYESVGVQSLKGKTIATFPPGSIQHILLSKWLTENGIDPENDVDIKAMGPSDAATAISAKAVDAVFLPSPTPTIIEVEGNGVIVAWSGSILPNHACCCVVASGEMMREHPEIVKQIIKTHIRATEYEIAHPDEAAEIYAKWQDADVSTIKQSIDVTDMHWIHDPGIEVDSGLEYAKVTYELNRERYEDMGVKVLEKEDMFDTSFYDEVTRER
jgi:NitT/TauT family transport system substrate-binding protein